MSPTDHQTCGDLCAGHPRSVTISSCDTFACCRAHSRRAARVINKLNFVKLLGFAFFYSDRGQKKRDLTYRSGGRG